MQSQLSKLKKIESGEIPEEWNIKKLIELLSLLKDGTHTPPSRVIEGIPLLSAEGIHDGIIDFQKGLTYITQKDYNEIHKKYEIKKNDLLLTIVGTLGRVSLVHTLDKKFSVQRSVSIIRPNKDILPIFLYYFFQTKYYQQQLINKSKSTAQRGIYLGELGQIPIFYPKEIKEQQNIASILSNVDELIQKTNQIIDQTQMLKKGLINKLVTNGLDIRGLSRTRIPHNYRYEELNNVLTINPKYKLYNDKEYPFVEMAALNEKTKSIEYFGNRKQSSGYSVFKNDDTIFARITPCTENGKICLVSNLKNYGLGSTEFIVLSPNDKNELLPDFLCYYCQTDRVRNYAVSQMRGATGRQRVPDKVFKNDLFIILPDIETQKKIVSTIKSVENYVNKVQDEKKKVQNLKIGLMQQLLTGKIRVKV
jgi:type I restriction enzyme S subunit